MIREDPRIIAGKMINSISLLEESIAEKAVRAIGAVYRTERHIEQNVAMSKEAARELATELHSSYRKLYVALAAEAGDRGDIKEAHFYSLLAGAYQHLLDTNFPEIKTAA